MLLALVIWQSLSLSGLFYRDVVPSLPQIAAALGKLAFERRISTGTFGSRFDEIATALLIGGVAGLVVGLVIGGNKFIAAAFEPLSLLSRPHAEDHLLPGSSSCGSASMPDSKIAMGALSCFFPIALNVAAGMRQIDKVLIKVGESFRANAWQMAAKIYLPAMRHPVINGLRLGLGVAADRHAARGNQTVQSRHRLSCHQRL